MMKNLKVFLVFFVCVLCVFDVRSQDNKQDFLPKGSDTLGYSKEPGWKNVYIQLPLDQRILTMMEIVDSLEKEISKGEYREGIESELQRYRNKIEWRKKYKIIIPNDYAVEHFFRLNGGDLHKRAKDNDQKYFAIRRIVIIAQKE